MGAVGQVILTLQGVYALADAQITGRNIKPKYYKVSNQDLPLDPTIRDLTGVWKQDNISGYIPIDKDTVEYVIDIPTEQATNYGKTFGLYLEDGTLFAIAKPPYPFPPFLRQTFRIQIRYSNINQITDFQYIPFFETEQYLSLLNHTFTVGESLQIARNEIEDLKLAKETLFRNDREYRQRIENLEQASLEIRQAVLDIQQAVLDLTFTVGELLREVRNELEDLKLAKETLFRNDKEFRNQLIQ